MVNLVPRKGAEKRDDKPGTDHFQSAQPLGMHMCLRC